MGCLKTLINLITFGYFTFPVDNMSTMRAIFCPCPNNLSNISPPFKLWASKKLFGIARAKIPNTKK
jgi:hypothetical protein